MSAVKRKNNQFDDMNQKIRGPSSEQSQSIEQCKDKLRDTYMNYSDLQERCVFNMQDKQKLGDDHNIFYFKPETFLLQDPEQQRLYREHLIKKVSSVPKPEPIAFLGDDFHRNFNMTVSDRSSPGNTKKTLHEYFLRRQYALQHLKYKLLTRWAHHTLTSEITEIIGTEATFFYGKIEYNLEQAIKRCERLENEDFWDSAKPELRPSTKAGLDSAALYIENIELEPQSLIREDDIEVYLRGVCYRNKINRVVNKFMSRFKWTPMHRRYEIFEQAITHHQSIKQHNLKQQLDFKSDLEAKARATTLMTPELEAQLAEISEEMHCHRYQQMFTNKIDKIKHNWKAIHDKVPELIADQLTLKLLISSRAKSYKLNGDIETDHGYSFSYQISVFFPTYFQKQVIKSQFSIFDLFAHEYDKNQEKKRTLTMITRIDTNIFRDISSTKTEVPSDEMISKELKDSGIKVIRMKSAAFWVGYICLTANEPEWHRKQFVILNNENPIDSLVKSGLNFLDVNDLATVQRITEDNCVLHQQNIRKIEKNNPHNQVKKGIRMQDGERVIQVDQMPFKNGLNLAANIESLLLTGVQESTPQQDETIPPTAIRSGFRNCPHHLLNAYYTLRFMHSRDCKTKILYTLNYFRSIQKRIAIDLREFGTRERMDSHMKSDPFVRSRESNQQVINLSHTAASFFVSKDPKSTEEPDKPKMTVFDEKAINDMKNMASLRGYKCNGQFNQQIRSTCPGFPKFHDTFGEATSYQSTAQEQDDEGTQRGFSERAIKFMGRIDHIEIAEATQEVYVKDDFSIYIIYDCVFQDMSTLEEELCKIASYYINKAEVLTDPTSKTNQRPAPVKDRLEVIDDLLGLESQFQFKKVKLVQVYMECYEHIVDPLEQQRLMQIITDISALRPRLNLTASYFKDSYEAEIQCLDQQFELIRMMVDLQVSLEKTENKRLQDSLNLSYCLANLYEKNMWKYSDQALLFEELVRFKRENLLVVKKLEVAIKKKFEKEVVIANKQKTDEEERKELDKLEANENDEFNTDAYFQLEEDQFANMIGLSKVTIETIYANYQDKDTTILNLMNENANFITTYEGYPEFLTHLVHKSVVEKNRLFKPNSWSQATGALDFYDSLDFVTRNYSLMQNVQQELYDVLKPYDATVMTSIDTIVAMVALEEFRKVMSFMEGSKTEYPGREFVEDEQIMGNSEKQIFYAKEMISDLTSKPKQMLDPYLVAKLDVRSVHFFEFPQMSLETSKYTLRTKGISGLQYMQQAEQDAIVGSAITKTNLEKTQIKQKPVDLLVGKRAITVPSLLNVFCNMVELHRLRNEIILAATETMILQDLYSKQQEQANCKNIRVELENSVSFLPLKEASKSTINFVDHGPSHHLKIGLAIKEFDPELLSNFNFMNSDSLKFNILNSGLEEVRGILQYQLLQKNLLICATRSNQLVLDHHLRANSELNLMESDQGSLPNPVVMLNLIFNKQYDGLDSQKIKEVRQSYFGNLSTYFGLAFYNVQNKKNQLRNQMANDFTTYQITASTIFNDNHHCLLRVMRCFKLKLLTQYIQKIMIEVSLDATKIQAVHSCQRLRQFNRLFNFNPKALGLNGEQKPVFKYETNSLIENFPAYYMPQEFQEDEFTKQFGKASATVKAFNPNDSTILDFNAIPSSFNLLTANACGIEAMRDFQQRKNLVQEKYLSQYSKDIKQIPPDLKDPEVHLRALLPTFTVLGKNEMLPEKKQFGQRKKEEAFKRKFESQNEPLDYEEALYFGDSQYANSVKYYLGLERIITLEWFLNKLQFNANEIVYLDAAIQNGLPFWQQDQFDQRIMNTLGEVIKKRDSLNQRSQDLYYARVVDLRQKKQIAEEVTSFGQVIVSLIAQMTKTKKDQRLDYLQNYTDFRYLQVVGSLHRLVHQFFIKKKINSVQSVQQVIAELTKMDHVRVKMIGQGNYNVCTSLVNPQMQMLAASNLIFGSMQIDQVYNFRRCVQPIVNERALEPSQLTMFQSIYKNDYLRRQTQFVGQTSSTVMNPFQALETALLGLNQDDRNYSQSFIVQFKYQANDFMETMYGDTSLASLTNEDVYDNSQLQEAMNFMQLNTQALLLRNAVMCWTENSTLPQTIELFEKFEVNFKTKFFWKILQYKQQMVSKWSSGNGIQIPTQEQLKELKSKIDNFQNDQTLATKSAEQQRDALVKALQSEFNAMKKKVTIDNYFTTKAEIEQYRNEMEKFLMMASIKVLEDECAALAKCFTVQVPHIQYHIHPFQQFAATIFDRVDSNLHLDMATKVSAVQVLLTRLRNRGTSIETLTSGPGMVFTIKDLNDCLSDFSRQMITYSERELKSRSDLGRQQNIHYQESLYMKDQKISWLEHRLKRVGINLESIIDSRLFEKGNQLIYELDHSNRVLSLFKKSFYDLERTLTTQIQAEQAHKFKRAMNLVERKTANQKDYIDFLKKFVNAGFAEENDLIKSTLKIKVQQYTSSGKNSQKNETKFYPQGNHKQVGNAGAVVPEGFKHYSHCSCYVPDERFPKPTLELAEIEMMSEQEARNELVRMCDLVRKQRLLWRTKEMCQQQKYQDKINLLVKQLSNNTYLWDQMAESQKRERVLQQELRFTQQSLAAAEKTIAKLLKESKEGEAERARLEKFKSSKGERLKELEEANKNVDLFENVDVDKLLAALTKKEEQLKVLSKTKEVYDYNLNREKQQYQGAVLSFQKKLGREQQMTRQVILRMEQLQLELKEFEVNEPSVGAVWKQKCIEIFEVAQQMRYENIELRSKCKKLIEQGISLAETVEDFEQQFFNTKYLEGKQFGVLDGRPDGKIVDTPMMVYQNAATNVQSMGSTNGFTEQKSPEPSSLSRGHGFKSLPYAAQNKKSIRAVLEGKTFSVEKLRQGGPSIIQGGNQNYQTALMSRRNTSQESRQPMKQKHRLQESPNLNTSMPQLAKTDGFGNGGKLWATSGGQFDIQGSAIKTAAKLPTKHQSSQKKLITQSQDKQPVPADIVKPRLNNILNADQSQIKFESGIMTQKNEAEFSSIVSEF